jgi:hypothetical protein
MGYELQATLPGEDSCRRVAGREIEAQRWELAQLRPADATHADGDI